MKLGSGTKLISMPTHQAGVMVLDYAIPSGKHTSKMHLVTKVQLLNTEKELLPH